MSKHSDSDSNGDRPGQHDGERWTQVAQRHHDPERTNDLTTSIIGAIAEARGVEMTDVTAPPLYNCVDTEAIETAFFGPSARGRSPNGAGRIEFSYGEFLVTVRSDGWIQVAERSTSE